MLNLNFLQFGEILGILPNTVTQAARSFKSKYCGHLILPTIEIPKWFEFNHHQSVENSISFFSVSFLVGPKFSNLVVCFAFPSKETMPLTQLRPLYNDNCWSVKISINGSYYQNIFYEHCNENCGHLWLIYEKVNISNPSEENRIIVKLKSPGISLNGMKIYVECICCPQKPNISPVSSMDQWAFNNGEEDSGRVGVRCRLRRRNHRPTHSRRPQKHYLSRFGWLRIRFQLWKRSSKPWRRQITNGFHDERSSSIPNTFLNDDTNANLYPPSKKTKTS